MKCVQTADENTNEVRQADARPATSVSAAKTLGSDNDKERASRNMPNEIRTSEPCGLADGEDQQDGKFPRNSTNSDTHSSISKRRYRRPTTALQLAAQANAVATALLNGTLDLDTARAYGTIARTAAQALGIEVQTGRFLKTEASLSMDWEPEDQDGTS